MTTALQRPGQNGRVHQPGAPLPDTAASGLPRPRGSWFARDPAWPIVALLAGWPLWWMLGIGTYMTVLAAIPMARRLYLWRATRSRAIRVPPAFGLWLLFLLVMFAGIATLSLTAPGTEAGPVSHRLVSWGLRALSYVAVTVILLFAGNLTERELPRRRLAFLLGLVVIYTVAGGLLGVLLPSFHFTSPLAAFVPASIQASDTTIASMLHPSVTQHQTFEGFGRPAAPFTYSNGWGDNLAVLLPWLIVGWRVYGTRWQRRIMLVVLAAALIPIVLSFDRGLWIGLALAACYMMARLTTQANMSRLVMFVGGLIVFALVIVATPLGSLISARIGHATSNAGRADGAAIAIQGALASPFLGFGDTRHEQGSSQSIAVGRTANCSDCGDNDVGSHGQLWLLLFANGIPGTICYLGFFGYGVWRFRRDKTPYGLAGVLVLLLGFVFMFVYLTIGITLSFTILAYAMLWRNDMYRQDELAAAAETDGPAGRGGNGRGIAAGVPA